MLSSSGICFTRSCQLSCNLSCCLVVGLLKYCFSSSPLAKIWVRNCWKDTLSVISVPMVCSSLYLCVAHSSCRRRSPKVMIKLVKMIMPITSIESWLATANMLTRKNCYDSAKLLSKISLVKLRQVYISTHSLNGELLRLSASVYFGRIGMVFSLKRLIHDA